jgi:hypothetical protein
MKVANLPLRRPYERVLFVFYLLGGLASTVKVDGAHAEATLITVWLSFILAISFMEAWVRLKAPLPRKNIAVDVGRRIFIFAALNAVEFGLAGAFWITRYTKGSSNSSAFPAAATAVLLFLSFFLLPLIFLRAKQKIVNEAGPPEIWTKEEKAVLKKISNEISGQPLAPKKLPVAYAVLEMTKAVCLLLFLCGL